MCWHRLWPVAKGKIDSLRLDDAIPLVIPVSMMTFAGVSPGDAFWMWMWVTITSSLFFHIIAFNGAHHHPEIFHEGDAPRYSVFLYHILFSVVELSAWFHLCLRLICYRLTTNVLVDQAIKNWLVNTTHPFIQIHSFIFRTYCCRWVSTADACTIAQFCIKFYHL